MTTQIGAGYDVTVDGASLLTTYGLVLTSDTDLGAPEAKTYTVDIPGGNGSIDLTEALTGDVAYDAYEMTLVLSTVEPTDVRRLRQRLRNRYHGRRLGYQLAIDPGYTYTGRFDVAVEPAGVELPDGTRHATVTLTVTCDPYKLKEHCAYRLNATGGRLYRFESGRRPVHPTIECESVCFVTWEGETVTVPAGTYRLNDVVFREGFNELYVNTQPLFLETWGDLAEGGKDAMTWGGASAYRWDDLQRLGIAEGAPQSWDELGETRWEELGEAGSTPKRWSELDYRHSAVTDATAYLTYDWEDL